MTNKTVTLSRELVERIAHPKDCDDGYFQDIEALRAALAVPVPPARGEVEVLPQRKTGWPALSNHRSYNDGFNKACDEWMPHVTRLQAEVERLKEVATDRKNELTGMCTQVVDLQSELTKARELLTDICDTAYIQSSEGADAYGAAREYLAEQRGKS